MREKKKTKKVKTRASIVEHMVLHCKPYYAGNTRKEDSRKACRRFRRVSKEQQY